MSDNFDEWLDRKGRTKRSDGGVESRHAGNCQSQNSGRAGVAPGPSDSMGSDMSDHIPGPWNYSQESVDPEWWIVTIDGGLIIANVNAHHRQIANARLIAAAPDLLELAAEAMWRRDYPNGGSVYKTYDSLGHHDKELHRKDALAAALRRTAPLRSKNQESAS